MAVESSTAEGTGITEGAVYRIADKVPLLFYGDGRQFIATVANEIMTKALLPQPPVPMSFSPEWHKRSAQWSREIKGRFYCFESEPDPALNQYLCGDSGLHVVRRSVHFNSLVDSGFGWNQA